MAVEVVVFAGDAEIQCSQVAETFDVSWTEGWGNGAPGGPQMLSWKMDLDPRWRLPWLRSGVFVAAYYGTELRFYGKLNEPVQGSPWEFHASGISLAANDAPALDSAGLTTSKPRTAVYEAQLRGELWGWTPELAEYAGISDDVFSASEETVKLNTVRALLDAYTESEGLRWRVRADGLPVIEADPSPTAAPDWLVVGGPVYLAETDVEVVTRLYGRYVSGVDTYAVEVETNVWAETLLGFPKPETVDLTALGLMSSLRAAGILRGKLDLLALRSGWTSPVLLTKDNLRTPGGVVGDPALVQAGQKVRVLNVVADHNGNVDLGAYADLTVSNLDYSATDDAATVTPPGFVARDFGSVLADAVAPERPEFAEI